MIELERSVRAKMLGNAVIYKNLLYACFATKRGDLHLAFLNLDCKALKSLPLFLRQQLGLPTPRSLKEEQLSSLFLNENESDIKFKIKDKIIPAHKKILIQKSKFFANLFNSK